MASVLTNAIKGRLLGDNAQITTAVDMEADTMRLMLVTSGYTPDIDADVFITAANGSEITSSGSYTAGLSGGASLTEVSTTDDTDNEGVFDATDVAFTSATITAAYAVIYKDTGTAATSPIVCVIDFGGDKTSTAGTFTIAFAAEGIINLG